jgi:hypothetical protein
MNLILAVMFCSCENANSKKDSPSTAGFASAKEGDSVWVIINHIKPDRREQFERFLHQSFWPMAKSLSAKERELFERTRILKPTQPEADSSYTYIFIMDPVIPGGNYDIGAILKKMYGEKAGEYGKDFDEASARPQTQYRVVQDKYYRY